MMVLLQAVVHLFSQRHDLSQRLIETLARHASEQASLRGQGSARPPRFDDPVLCC